MEVNTKSTKFSGECQPVLSVPVSITIVENSCRNVYRRVVYVTVKTSRVFIESATFLSHHIT
jgi:hypothetical protein